MANNQTESVIDTALEDVRNSYRQALDLGRVTPESYQRALNNLNTSEYVEADINGIVEIARLNNGINQRFIRRQGRRDIRRARQTAEQLFRQHGLMAGYLITPVLVFWT
jgi:hypothetical protein